MKFRRPSPATVIACIALFAALSGGAYAAAKIKKLPKNIVSAKSIKNGAVTGPKIKKGAIDATKLAPGVGGGTAGYARVTNAGATESTPVADAANTKDVTVAPTTGKTVGEVCVDATSPIKSLTATAENSGPGQAIVTEVVLTPGTVCSSTSDALVITKNAATGDGVNADFYVTLFG